MALEAGFEPPVLEQPIDVEESIRSCPRSAETRGTYFQFALGFVEEKLGAIPPKLFEGVGARRWIAWNSYPLVDFMRLAVNAAGLALAGRPLGEGLRQIGWMAYPSFAGTMAGRVVIYAFGEDLDALMMALPRAYGLSLTKASVVADKRGERHWEVKMRDVYNFPATYHVGVLEGAVRARGQTPQIRIRRHPRACDVDLEVRW